MFNRALNIEDSLDQSIFLFGPRGAGKTSWVKAHFKDALYFNLLNEETYIELLGQATRLDAAIPPDYKGWVIIDEVQKIPTLLNEVHRLIEERKLRFVLTGSSARSLRKKGVNLLAGRALTYYMHPFIAQEIGDSFTLKSAIKYGMLPMAVTRSNKSKYLDSYINTYLREEVLQEGLTRNINLFARFLETASFSQGETLNYTAIAREIGCTKDTVSNFFDILEDLLIAYRIPVFKKRAKRNLTSHPKFYYFDVGVYRSIRPMGILDSPEEVDGPALETLFLQQIKAINDYFDLGYTIYYWRTQSKSEVDFVLYGKNGFLAFEIKRKIKLQKKDFTGLKLFAEDYPEAKLYMLCGTSRTSTEESIQILPFEEAIKNLADILVGNQ